MGQNFADKLRDIANQESENDEALIQKINSIFDRYAPKLKGQIPEDVQNDLVKTAKQKQHKKIISIDDYLSSELKNEKAITTNDCLEDIKNFESIFAQAQSNSLIDYKEYDGAMVLEYKVHDDRYAIYYRNQIFIFSIVLGTKSLAKVLKNEGFEVSVSGPKKLRVKW